MKMILKKRRTRIEGTGKEGAERQKEKMQVGKEIKQKARNQ